MKICFVSIESGIVTVGFRKMASLVRSLHPEAEICYIVPANLFSISSFWLGKSAAVFPESEIERIVCHLARADMVAFSSMTSFADLTKKLMGRIKAVNRNVFIIWGGIHAIVDPDDAIQHAHAVCIGEGEAAFRDFLISYEAGAEYTATKNFWFNDGPGRIIKNGLLPLQTPEMMEGFPLPLYADHELIYKRGRGFVPMGPSEYREFNGISYHTVWSIGCPYNCAFCSNSKFIENDSAYKKIRYVPASHIIAEVKNAIARHPYISAVVFHDDSFIGLPVPVLTDFAERWKKEININFSVVGALPSLINKEKMEILLDAGMRRIKMGIQTGSDRILKFYERPATAAVTQKAVSIISEFTGHMIPPTYDIILDNPIETRQDVIDSLEFVYHMPRPYDLNIFSLRLMPNTELASRLQEMNIKHPTITEKSYTEVKPSVANILMFLIDIVKPPRKMFDHFLKYVKPYREKQREFPVLLSIVRTIYLFKRGLHHLKFLDFSYFPGQIGEAGYFLWRTGVLRRHHQGLLRKYRSWKEGLC